MIDFSQFTTKYALNDGDVNLLNGFFARENVQQSIATIEQKRKKIHTWYLWGIGILVCYFLGFIVFSIFFHQWYWDIKLFIKKTFNQELDKIIFYLIALPIMGLIIYKQTLSHEYNSDFSIKNSILPLFVKQINPSIRYAQKQYLFKEDLYDVYQRTGLLENYDTIIRSEDSVSYPIQYQDHLITLSSYEIETVKNNGNKGVSKELPTNHCTITKIVFGDPRYTFSTRVLVVKKGRAGFFGDTFSRLTSSMKKIILDNVEFEAMFDVYTEDEIESRMLLTPNFMQHIVDISKQMDKHYELFVEANQVYIKTNLNDDYMDFSFTRDIAQSYEDYVKFYVEIRYLESLVKDLGLVYFDRGSAVL